jgi:hypothetical protein
LDFGFAVMESAGASTAFLAFSFRSGALFASGASDGGAGVRTRVSQAAGRCASACPETIAKTKNAPHIDLNIERTILQSFIPLPSAR